MISKRKSDMTLRRDLSFQLAFLYFAFVGIVLVASYFFVRYASSRLESDIITADLALANAIAQETFTASQSALQAVQTLSQNPAIIASDISEMEVIFRDAMSVRTDVNLIYRLDAQGIMTFHYPIGPESTVNLDFSFRPYFQQARIRTAPLLSSGRISPTTNQPVATAVMPIWSEQGEFLGLVAMNMKLQFLSDTLTNIASTSYSQETIQIAIIDSDGQIIAHSDSRFVLRDASVFFSDATGEVLSGGIGSLVADNADGREYIFSFVPIQNSGWGVVVMRPTSAAFSVLRSFQQGMLVVTGIFLVSGLIFWAVLSSHLIQPLERLASLSQEAWSEQSRSGDVATALRQLNRRSDQMGVLTRSLQQMHEAVSNHLKELTTLLETSAAVVSTLDSQVVLERILEQVEQLLGVQMSVIFVLDEEANLFRVEASRNLPDWYAEQVMIDPQDPNSVAMRAIRSGQPIQISDTETDPSYEYNRPRARKVGYRSVLAVKVPVQHLPPSVLLVCRTEPYTHSNRQINLLLSFANHASMAMDNAALYQRSDMNLQEQTRRLETLIQSLKNGLVLEDSEGNVLYANQRIQELVGLAPETIYQQSVDLLIDALAAQTAERETTNREIRRLLHDEGIRSIQIEQMGESQSRHLQLTLFDVENAKHLVTGRGWIVEDITQQYIVERMRSILIASVSHELRTPLAGIKGYVSTLLADDVEWDEETQREFLTIISHETDRLSKLVRDLMDMSRIEAGNLPVRRVLYNLNQMVDQIVRHAQPQIQQRLKINIAPDLPLVFIDPQRVETVLRNLIENAAKYSPEESPIRVTAVIQSDELVFEVADEGPGISQELRERVFDRFFRIENSVAQQAAGTGLGLAIARSFVQVHGGRIWLAPTDKGTCVTFAIPLQPLAEAQLEQPV